MSKKVQKKAPTKKPAKAAAKLVPKKEAPAKAVKVPAKADLKFSTLSSKQEITLFPKKVRDAAYAVVEAIITDALANRTSITIPGGKLKFFVGTKRTTGKAGEPIKGAKAEPILRVKTSLSTPLKKLDNIEERAKETKEKAEQLVNALTRLVSSKKVALKMDQAVAGMKNLLTLLETIKPETDVEEVEETSEKKPVKEKAAKAKVEKVKASVKKAKPVKEKAEEVEDEVDEDAIDDEKAEEEKVVPKKSPAKAKSTSKAKAKVEEPDDDEDAEDELDDEDEEPEDDADEADDDYDFPEED